MRLGFSVLLLGGLGSCIGSVEVRGVGERQVGLGEALDCGVFRFRVVRLLWCAWLSCFLAADWFLRLLLEF